MCREETVPELPEPSHVHSTSASNTWRRSDARGHLRVMSFLLHERSVDRHPLG